MCSLGDGSYEDVESGAPAPMRKVPGAWSALTGVKANECIDFPKTFEPKCLNFTDFKISAVKSRSEILM